MSDRVLNTPLMDEIKYYRKSLFIRLLENRINQYFHAFVFSRMAFHLPVLVSLNPIGLDCLVNFSKFHDFNSFADLFGMHLNLTGKEHLVT